MRYFLLAIFSCCLFFRCKEEDPIENPIVPIIHVDSNFFVDSRDGQYYKFFTSNGTTWMAEDLRLRDQEKYHYFDALKSCPEGWRLPTSNDWRELAEASGGYIDFSDTAAYGQVEIGDAELGFETLIDPEGFNANRTALYWTATPFHNEQFPSSLHSELISFDHNNVGKRVVTLSHWNHDFRIHCRCIRKPKEFSGSIQVNESLQFNDHFERLFENDSLLYLNGFNLTGVNDEDWVQMVIPITELQEEFETPVTVEGRIEYKRRKEISDLSNYRAKYTDWDLQIVVNQYTHSEIAGTFEGFLTSTWETDTVFVSGGSFSVSFQEN